jgi:hypothetical protein
MAKLGASTAPAFQFYLVLDLDSAIDFDEDRAFHLDADQNPDPAF